MEAELFQERRQAGLVVVLGDDLRAGRQARLHPGLDRRPRSTAFFARSPAATMTAGLEVFAQLVIAAITTPPWPSSYRLAVHSTSTLTDEPLGTASGSSNGSLRAD